LLAVTAASAAASPQIDDLYALSKLKSSLLSRSAHNNTLLADWDITPSAGGVSSGSPASHHYCNFSGITCDASNNRVVAINLTGVNLQDGVLPTEISLLDALSSLTVAACSLSGPIPASVSSMPLLRHLNLSNNNLAGPFPSPPERRRRPKGAASPAPYFPSLEVLDVYNNNLSGPLPPLGRSHARLRHLHLGGNYFTGGIPAAYGDMAELVYISLSANSLSGSVPPSLSRLKRLRQMYLGHYNSFDDGIPAEFGELEALVLLDMSSCGLTWSIPQELGGLTKLQTLYLHWNELSGEIPTQLGDLKSLVNIDISNNDLIGQIPASFTSLTRLKQLILFGNNLQGVIPESLGELAELEDLQIGSNNLTGGLPANLGKNRRLLHLDVSGNQLSGAIPPEIGHLKYLSWLDVSANALTSGIPPELSQCESLTMLDLSNNHLTGEVPEVITNLKLLATLNLSRNSIFGELPLEIRHMVALTSLDVSYNNLSGRVSESQLQGVFAVSNASDFEGNPGLCVEHVTAASCSRLQRSRGRGDETRTLLWLVPTVSAVLAAMAVFLGIWRRAVARRRAAAWKLTVFQSLDLGMDDMLGCLREENIVGKGGAGTVYRCQTRSGAEVAVKRLPGPGRRRDHGFRAEVATLCGVRHRNIVRLLGFASGAEGNLLLYEYMPGGSLGGVLHGARGAHLGWGARHRVATEAARALCYLHHECSPRILHRDIKCNNILLDAAMEAHVADFGLAKLLSRGASGSGTAVAAEECVSVIAGTYGYIAPGRRSLDRISCCLAIGWSHAAMDTSQRCQACREQSTRTRCGWTRRRTCTATAWCCWSSSRGAARSAIPATRSTSSTGPGERCLGRCRTPRRCWPWPTRVCRRSPPA
jgi:Leucine-rich repeat (LRR) protein